MARWIPLVVRPGPVFQAPDRISATRIALDLYGADLTSVQWREGRWVPMVVQPAEAIEARTRLEAEAKAKALHPDLVRVPSEVSHRIVEDQMLAVAEQRRRRLDDCA